VRRVASIVVAVALVAVSLSACLPTEPPTRTYTYSVIIDGPVVSNIDDFWWSAVVILGDARSWRGAGVQFVAVPEGGDFTLVLANPNEVPKYAPGVCDTTYSCQNGRFVVINDDRWSGGSFSWLFAPIDAYRAMVLNHEVGHWFGLGHEYCTGPGDPAPVMQQQSISLQGCAPNSWPLPWELDRIR
jgi:hypothetical protein